MSAEKFVESAAGTEAPETSKSEVVLQPVEPQAKDEESFTLRITKKPVPSTPRGVLAE
jgi:uncharacterized protein YrzB (UPF0473 family)